MQIITENTPNPNAMKFCCGVKIVSHPIFFENIEQAASASSLSIELFEIPGVNAVFFGEDFVTITKDFEVNWEGIVPHAIMRVTDYLLSGFDVLDRKKETIVHDYGNLSDIEKQIVDIIETRIRPAVAMDGGDIVYRGFTDGIVRLELRGACAGCPSATVTLKNGIESTLQYYVPEVLSVEAMEE